MAGMMLFVVGVEHQIAGWYNGWISRSTVVEPRVTGETVRVTRVIDGDTFETADGKKVRYIGINAPESVDPRRRAECFGKEATHFHRELVEGQEVRLEKDVSETDKYGRLLRFVFLSDGTLVNETLVSEGYAYASVYPPDISKREVFIQAEKEAREAQRGLWALETCRGNK